MLAFYFPPLAQCFLVIISQDLIIGLKTSGKNPPVWLVSLLILIQPTVHYYGPVSGWANLEIKANSDIVGTTGGSDSWEFGLLRVSLSLNVNII